jgi:arginine-tRNA-protein transferase
LGSKQLDLRLFVTGEYHCSYLPKRWARNLVVDPLAVSNGLYSRLTDQGFRRSGDHLYRPHCMRCSECVSLRVPVATFQPNRIQRRTWRKNRGLRVTGVDCRFEKEHFELFERYLDGRHPNGGMDDMTPDNYLFFIAAHWSHTRLYEFRQDGRLLAVAVSDRLSRGLSAVYTFFDPRQRNRSLGVYAILWQIAEAKRLGLDWVYLGYWIRECEKMSYKVNFKPCEVFKAGVWSSFHG